MRLPILEFKPSDGTAALARHQLTKAEAAVSGEMELVVAALPRGAGLEICHRLVANVGARHGLDRFQSIALWTRAALRLFEPGASDRAPGDGSPRLQKLIAFAFDEAGESVRATGVFHPFLVSVGDGPPALVRFPIPMGDGLFPKPLPAKAIQNARQAAGRLPAAAVAYAIASVQLPDDPRSVERRVYVEAADRRAPAGHLYAQDFRAPGRQGPFAAADPFERIGDAPNLIPF